VASVEDVRRLALAMPGASEKETRGNAGWCVGGKLFVWERPLRAPDLAALGERAPQGPILGVRVADLGEKEALLASDERVFFTTPHFDGYPAVLVRLEEVAPEQLEEIVDEAWLARAPARLAEGFLERR
jgi:hypothetical protein